MSPVKNKGFKFPNFRSEMQRSLRSFLLNKAFYTDLQTDGKID